MYRMITAIAFVMAMLLMPGALWAVIDIPPEGLSPLFERPPEEDLDPLPSLDPAEREELRETLDALYQLYHAKVYELRAEHYGITPDELEHRIYFQHMRGLDDWREVTVRIRAPLRTEHDPWVIETALGLVEEDPIDWQTLRKCMRVLGRTEVESESGRETLARTVLLQPIEPDQRVDPSPEKRAQLSAISSSCGIFVRHWPDDAPEILEVIYTLPHQPRERDILPVAESAPRSVEEDRDEHLAGRLHVLLVRHEPSKAAAVLERIEASLEAGDYTLDQEGEERVERLREHAREGVWWRRLMPW